MHAEHATAIATKSAGHSGHPTQPAVAIRRPRGRPCVVSVVWLAVLACPSGASAWEVSALRHRQASGYGHGIGDVVSGHARRQQRCSLRCCDGSSCGGSSLPCGILGVSVTDAGLAALISGGGRALPIPVTESDTESVTSAEGLCLLQLLQQIDLGSPSLPPEALATAAGASDAVLRSVELDGRAGFSLSVASPSSAAASSSSEAELEPRLVAVPPFEALALALRYNAPLRADPALFEQPAAFAEEECAARFPRAYTRADAKLQQSSISRRLAGLGEGPKKEPSDVAPSAAPTAAATAASGGDDYFAGQGSLDLTEAVAQALPPTPKAPVVRRCIDGPDEAVLRAALGIARGRGDTAAEEKILAKLEEIQREERDA